MSWAYTAVGSVAMGADRRERSPQITIRYDDPDLIDRVHRIARLRGEQDRQGHGLSAVVRQALRRYDGRYRHLLEPVDGPD